MYTKKQTSIRCFWNHEKRFSYCWWKKSCTSWYVRYHIIFRVLYIPGGCLGFLPFNSMNHQWNNDFWTNTSKLRIIESQVVNRDDLVPRLSVKSVSLGLFLQKCSWCLTLHRTNMFANLRWFSKDSLDGNVIPSLLVMAVSIKHNSRWWFQILFIFIPGEMIQFDWYFSDGVETTN